MPKIESLLSRSSTFRRVNKTNILVPPGKAGQGKRSYRESVLAPGMRAAASLGRGPWGSGDGAKEGLQGPRRDFRNHRPGAARCASSGHSPLGAGGVL